MRCATSRALVLGTLALLATIVGLGTRGESARVAPGMPRPASVGEGPVLEGRPAPERLPAPAAALELVLASAVDAPVPEVEEFFPAGGLRPEMLLTLRVHDATGGGVAITDVLAGGNHWQIPAGRTPRIEALPNHFVTVRLGAEDAQRFMTREVTMRAPAALPAEVQLTLPERRLLEGRPLTLVPIEVASGHVVPGGRWELPEEGPDVEALLADRAGRIQIPETLAERAGARTFKEPEILNRGLVLPGWTIDHDPDDMFWIRHVLAHGEIAIPVRRRPGHFRERHLRLLTPDGAPAVGVRVHIEGRRLRTDAQGVVAWACPPRGPDVLDVRRADGRPWEVFAIRSSVDASAPPRSHTLPEVRLVRLEFKASEHRAQEALSMSVTQPPERPNWDEEAGMDPGRGPADEEDLHGHAQFLDWILTPEAESVEVLLPVGRSLALMAIEPASSRVGSFTIWDLDLRVEPGDATVTLDRPPTRVVSRSSR